MRSRLHARSFIGWMDCDREVLAAIEVLAIDDRTRMLARRRRPAIGDALINVTGS